MKLSDLCSSSPGQIENANELRLDAFDRAGIPVMVDGRAVLGVMVTICSGLLDVVTVVSSYTTVNAEPRRQGTARSVTFVTRPGEGEYPDRRRGRSPVWHRARDGRSSFTCPDRRSVLVRVA